MNTFTMYQPRTLAEAATALREGAEADGRTSLPVLKAAGMDLIDHMKEGTAEPEIIVNLRRVNEPRMKSIDPNAIGALVTLTDIAQSKAIRKSVPVIAHAAGDVATPQVRNVATAAGNILQRPRCWYYRNEQFHCLKKGGHTCYAVEGENRYHAIFGDGPCHIVHPSNLANALAVCDGVIHCESSDEDGRTREIAIDEFFVMPDMRLKAENILEPNEIVTHVTFTPRPMSAHYEVREKQSFDWPIVMVSASIESLDGGVISGARVCAGAVAPIPWRLRSVERALDGVSIDDEAGLRAACAKSTNGAQPMSDNEYKLKLLPVAVYRAIRKAAGRPVPDLFDDRTA